MENKNVVCPICGCLKYYYKFIDYKEIILCSSCGYWDHYNTEVELELPNNHKVDND